MAIQVSKAMYNKILNAPKGVVPSGVQVASKVAKKVTSKEKYVSTKPSNFGNTYTRYGGVVSVLDKKATPESARQASALKRAQRSR